MARTSSSWAFGCVAAILASWLAGSAAGAPPSGSADRAAFARFKGLDRQADLSLTPDELAGARAAGQVFAILDRDGDDTLTAADGPPARRVLHRLEARTLSRGQFAALSPHRMVPLLDADGDGRLTLAELRPSLGGNAPLDTARTPPARPEIVEVQPRPQPCWYPSAGRWIELPANSFTCRMR